MLALTKPNLQSVAGVIDKGLKSTNDPCRIYSVYIGLIVVLAASILTITGCISVNLENFDENKRVAKIYVEHFHSLFNEEKYSGLYKMFSVKGRESRNLADFTQMLSSFRRSAGWAKESKLVHSSVSKVGSSTRVHMFFETHFDNVTRFEEFDCLVDGESALIDFYGLSEKLPT